MTKEKLAEQLNGREYGSEITEQESNEAEKNKLVVVFGYSDDNTEFRGKIDEEIGCYKGANIYFNKKGEFAPDEDDEDDDVVHNDPRKFNNHIEAVWCPKEPDCSWIYKTQIPHSTFDIMKDGELYCRGIVFSIDSLK